MQTTQQVACPLAGFEGVTVAVNMMATVSQFDAFVKSMGRQEWKSVIAEVTNWPDGYAGGPQSGDAPMAWRLWLARQAVGDACVEFVKAPN